MSKLSHWLQAQSKEALMILRTYLLSYKSLRTIEWADEAQNATGPILLIHGYLNYRSVWLHHGKYLQKKGLGPIFTLNLGNPFCSIETYAAKVAKKVKEIKEKTGSSTVILIGHSMGGLVCSHYALELAPKNEVQSVITIGSPLHGTKLAWVGLGRCAAQMRLNSSYVNSLREKILKEKDTRFYHIATLNDQIVIPYHSALLGTDPNRVLTLDKVGHVGLLYSDRVSKQICDWIANA